MPSNDDFPADFIEAAREVGRKLAPHIPEEVKRRYLALLIADQQAVDATALRESRQAQAAIDELVELTPVGVPWRSRWLAPLVLDALASGLGRRTDELLAQAALADAASGLRSGDMNLAVAAAQLGGLAQGLEAIKADVGVRDHLAQNLGVDLTGVRAGGNRDAVASAELAVDLLTLAVLQERLLVAWGQALGVDDVVVALVGAGLTQHDAVVEARAFGLVCPPPDIEFADERTNGPLVAMTLGEMPERA